MATAAKALAGLILALAFPAHAGVRVEKLAEGIYAANSVVFIVNEEDVVVVDANATPAAARETIQALKAITSKHVRYLVYTSLHVDNVGGSWAWKEAYPLLEAVAHVSAWRDTPNTRAELMFPGISVEERFVLERAEGRSIEIRHRGAGRLVVNLPKEKIAVPGP